MSLMVDLEYAGPPQGGCTIAGCNGKGPYTNIKTVTDKPVVHKSCITMGRIRLCRLCTLELIRQIEEVQSRGRKSKAKVKRNNAKYHNIRSINRVRKIRAIYRR